MPQARVPPRRAAALAAVVVAVVVACSSGAATGTPAATQATPRRDPVLLVHGFMSWGGDWEVLRSRLLAAGYRDSEIAAISYDSNQPNVAIAEDVAAAVEDLRARTGAKRIDIVSHSMGAISSRWYVEELGGDERVDAWVSIAGVNGGTYFAYGCLGVVSCVDMLPGSDTLAVLERDLDTDGAVRFGAWWSLCDTVVVPAASARLPGARNVRAPCLDHFSVKDDPTVLAQVERFLRAKHAAR